MPPRKPPSTDDGRWSAARKLRQRARDRRTFRLRALVEGACRISHANCSADPAPSIKTTGTPACPAVSPPIRKAIADALQHRFGETLRGRREPRRASTRLPASPAAGASALHDRAVDPAAAAASVRLRAVGAEQERPAAGRHRDPREARADRHRRSHSRPAVYPHCAGVPGVPRQRPPAAEISKMRGKPFPNDHLDQFFNAAVDAGIVLATFIARRRRGGPRHLPDQRDPRSFREGERYARSCRSG